MASQPTSSKTLSITLWIVQALLALFFVGTGIFKLITPIPKLAQMWSWAGEYPLLVYVTGFFDLLGGIGIILPSLTRMMPNLSVLAAFGCAALMVVAIIFHLSRGEGANTPFNFIILALILFVFWGRRTKAPIANR